MNYRFLIEPGSKLHSQVSFALNDCTLACGRCKEFRGAHTNYLWLNHGILSLLAKRRYFPTRRIGCSDRIFLLHS